ncbi:MAG: tRNA 2-thiouridine(34) synthase MnmA [Ignavibacteriales bacterium]|nr:tRNA 2-thiouridine(34) synthase MnmA [Ignavibacteriales bacterium]
MSGGVDSSVAAALLKQEGYEVIGITMKTWGFMEVGGAPKHESGCCSLDAIFDAKSIATKFDFPHYTVDFTKAFEDAVITDFVDEYLDGRTPNPCVICNRKIKWEELLLKADSLDAYYVATGHYANIEFNENSKRYLLKNSADSKKDQTYALWGLTQKSLSRTLLPLGKYTKPEVREIAEKLEIKTANKPDSQEICFVADNNYERFLRERVPEKISEVEEGNLVYNNETIGKHRGIPFYTIGQRKGLGVALGKPVYVKNIDKENNIVELGDDTELFSKDVIARDINYISVNSLNIDDTVIAKIRYSDRGSLAKVKFADEQKIILEFVEPKRAITPGQSLAIYDEQGYLLAGGVIAKEKH